ncbi:MAG: radical SAM protein [Syntrophales bacterium]|nr:radical SAM protein [Syntrophales bacterium]MDD5640271.1 radical SAM protein [Syntrophales bacterium]
MIYLFGPVPSRRLGRSLGVDLIPRKSCPYDCLYCEVGPTTHQTLNRMEYQTEAIIEELRAYLTHPQAQLDYITLAGSGEPTLNLGLGRIIKAIKEMTETPVAVLTNGALLHLPEVRRDLKAADVILPSLDSVIEKTWRLINRPLPEMSLAQMIEGLFALRREYRGQIWLEIMLLKGLNDTEEELAALRRVIGKLSPDKVQLNTAVRPVVDEVAQPLDEEEMEAAAAILGPTAEVIAACSRSTKAEAGVSDARFIEMLARRPMTAADVAQVLGLPLDLVKTRLKRLCKSGLVDYSLYQEQGFYSSC